MVPKSDIPRSNFRIQTALKTAFNSGDLVPFFITPVTPGDTYRMRGTFFARLATPIFPFMDNLHLDTFYFFCPTRLVWNNFAKFMGEQDNPGDSIDYTMPQAISKAGGYDVGSVQDFFGLPSAGQVGVGGTYEHDACPLRAYYLIYNQWFRDQNLQNSLTVHKDDGPDDFATRPYALQKRNKRHDYFTGCLPSPQKGNVAATIPLGTSAPVTGIGFIQGTGTGIAGPITIRETLSPGESPHSDTYTNYATAGLVLKTDTTGNSANPVVQADLTDASAATINQMRTAITLQQFLEKDARGGTRYTEIILSHFNVRSPDARLQRTEYLGGGSQPIQVRPVEQTASTDATSPQGNLAAYAEVVAHHGFHQSFTEHGYIIGLLNVRADLTYQQGLRRFWSRQTRYDYPWPVFANLGEQAVISKEIYLDVNSGNDETVFGYQERYAEERYIPSMITGLMRSTAANTIDTWHLAQDFTSRPTLSSAFIKEAPPLQRVLAVGTDAAGQELIMDAFFDINATKALPMYGVPGLFRF